MRGPGRDSLACLGFSGLQINLGSVLGNIMLANERVGPMVPQPGPNLLVAEPSSSADCLDDFEASLYAFNAAFGAMLLKCSLRRLGSTISC